ncbi:PAS domain-containing sensor histidine kinase [Limimaricola pyoseonensis]|uniref:histidine kinase n=1 Tax=Limimaricola pyoseonensis TaxID=521013 RepID=A0A1G7JGS9_9RHOB|nr:HWE histidine kinase domain-containing protein [Limimaricola pyoseonensis]SDF24121.1 PAS domain S-box-containing protein [Limimaricola pyoseonensis]
MAKDGAAERRNVLAELVEDAPCGIVVTDPDGRLQYVNETLSGWLGWRAMPGDRPQRLPDLMTMPGRLYYETHLAPMMRLQGFAREISCALVVEGGAKLPVLLSGVARRDEDGIPYRFDYTIFDARERHLYEEELRVARRQADELAAIVRSSPNAILRVERDGRITGWNGGAERMFGRRAEAALGELVQDLVRFEGRPDWFGRAVAACEEAEEHVFEASWQDGRDAEVTVAPIRERGPAGPSRCHSVILRDISLRKQAERHLQIAMGEMKHRVKNTLAVVAGIARQTLPPEARDHFSARLRALAMAQDALARPEHEGADLRDLLEFTAQEAGGADRLRVQGPPLMLSPRQATCFSMALHELVTNALKYGALSDPNGHVLVTYGLAGDADDGSVRFVWQERDGPVVTPPAHRGFGSKMIGAVVEAELRAEVRLEYPPEGGLCEIVFRPDAAGPP